MTLLALSVMVSALAGAEGEHAPVPTTTKRIEVGRRFSVTTSVVEVAADGALRPLPGALAWVIGSITRPGPHGGTEEVVARASARTDADGRLLVADAPFVEEAQYRVEVPFQGVPYRSASFGASDASPREVRVFRATTDMSNLRLRLLFDLQIGDGSLQVTQLVRVENTGLSTVDTTQTPLPLRLPGVGFRVFGRVPTWGFFPQGQPVGGAAASTRLGKVLGERGALAYRGPILPGNELFFQYRYSVPYAKEDAFLGAVADLPVEELLVTVRHPDHVAVRMHLDGVSRAIESREGSQIRRDMFISGPLPVGHPIHINLERLPAESPVPATMVLWAVAAMVLVTAALIVGARRRSVVPVASIEASALTP